MLRISFKKFKDNEILVFLIGKIKYRLARVDI